MSKKLLAIVFLAKSILFSSMIFVNMRAESMIYPKRILQNDFRAFLKFYHARPIKNNVGGLRSVGMFLLWYLLRECNPDVVIESGVFKGQSTWLIEQAVPNAQLICIDPNLKRLVYKSVKAKYFTQDFSLLKFDSLAHKKVLCFFDDHQNAYLRVLQAYNFGFKYLVFDDNYPFPFGTYEHGHLTLRHCFEMEEHKAKAEELRSLIKFYCIMPQIFECPAIVEAGQCMKNAAIEDRAVLDFPVIWKNLSSIDYDLRDAMMIFWQEAATYRWMTYIEL